MKNKNKFNNLNKNYFKIPLNLFDLNLSINSIGLYTFLLSCAEDFNPSVTFLSRKLKVSRNTVYKYLNELKLANTLSILTEPSEGEVTKYQFIQPSNWKKL